VSSNSGKYTSVPFNEPGVAQASEEAGNVGGEQMRKKRFQVGAANATGVELQTLKGAQQGMLGLATEPI
jgi:hypothetical protein